MNSTDQRARLLVVEDDPAIRHLLTYLLDSSYKLCIASFFDEAIQMAGRETFDLLLFDVNLGEPRSGIDLLDRLRRLPAFDDVPAVACTAYVLPDERARFLASGFDGYIGKPFTRKELLHTIETSLREGRRLEPTGDVPDEIPSYAVNMPHSEAA